MKQLGSQTWQFTTRPVILGSSAVVGPEEGKALWFPILILSMTRSKWANRHGRRQSEPFSKKHPSWH